MITVFNPDMAQRLADLHAAASSGDEITVEFRSAFQHKATSQPDRIVVGIVGTPRSLTFGMDMAQAVAEQLAANGNESHAAEIREHLG
jgi:hypothetical protein